MPVKIGDVYTSDGAEYEVLRVMENEMEFKSVGTSPVDFVYLGKWLVGQLIRDGRLVKVNKDEAK